ncbi:MAG: ParA family protein [Deltaproteobacteria bacterium]|nr:ParA family protein [Deltaproteobacteria bacterium]
MNGAELRSRVESNLRDDGLDGADIRVQPDAFVPAWRIVVVAQGFEGKTAAERREVILRGINPSEVEWMEALTPREREWAGSLPIDSDLSDLPLWPEALARGAALTQPQSPITFPSDLDEDIDPPIVATFYSLRGGVGRSTALAYTAKILASNGRKVVCVDMDLEAPGLASLFGKEKDVQPGQGLVSLLVSLDRGETPDVSKHLIQISQTEDLYCLPAGRPDHDYARLLRYIDPGAWYREERNPLHELMQKLRTGLPFVPDVILLDARTGITPISGPALFDLADLAIVVFFPHPQAHTGTGSLVKALVAAHTRRRSGEQPLSPEPRFVVSPMPPSKTPDVVRRYEHRAVDWISDWLSALKGTRQDSALVESEITHFVPYKETIATSDSILSDQDVWLEYQPIAEWIERFLPAASEKTIDKALPSAKKLVLEQLRFSAGMAEQQEDFLSTFVETDLVRRALDPKVPLVLGRKGTGKTALFRRLAEDPAIPAVVVTAPAPLRSGRGWLLGPDGFRGIAEVLASAQADWRQFWTLYVGLACHYSLPWGGAQRPAPDEAFQSCLSEDPRTELDVVRLVQGLLSVQNFGLIASDWLARLDEGASPSTVLLLDGLDTGFGSSDDDRRRRQTALEGLAALLLDRVDNLTNLRFKVVLREDIWRQLKFENKSHFFGRTVALRWVDKTSFFKVVLKQALRSQQFRELLDVRQGSTASSAREVDAWGELELLKAWNVLVGERMRGSGTAFTRNWIWNRTADANEDHSPRYLLQLMHEATSWEQREHPRSPYDRSIVRPRALIGVLPQVSEQALGALKDEEFPELGPLLDKLTIIGRTPFGADDLDIPVDLINLGREVGLLGVYEGSDEHVERYKVPELFRYGLRMTRKGQA